jgi:hypothetical protein
MGFSPVVPTSLASHDTHLTSLASGAAHLTSIASQPARLAHFTSLASQPAHLAHLTSPGGHFTSRAAQRCVPHCAGPHIFRLHDSQHAPHLSSCCAVLCCAVLCRTSYFPPTWLTARTSPLKPLKSWPQATPHSCWSCSRG